MSFHLGRRRSQTDATSKPDNSSTSPSPDRNSSKNSLPNEVREFHPFRRFFRKRSGSASSADSRDVSSPNRTVQHTTQDLVVGRQKPELRRSHSEESVRSQSSGHDGPKCPSAAAHNEPKQPGNIQDYLDYRLEKAGLPDDSNDPRCLSDPKPILTKKDVKALFSGAPHFMLERGKHGRWYPQVIFPWDEHNLSIQRMMDRKPLAHASFTLCTLHTHLPVPDDWAVKGGVPIPVHDWRRSGAAKRATFDVGIFEVPNMLGNNGREPGTIGFRNFLELSIADILRYTGPGEPRPFPGRENISALPATEAFELMDHYDKPYSQCLSGAVFDRQELIKEGPSGWKRIGVRDINLRFLVHRLDQLRQLRQDLLLQGSNITILDVESPHELHHILHTHFLHPRPPPADLLAGHPQGLKSQIKTIATVLATPGAWVDFSVPEWRLRAGQILWEASLHNDGDSTEANNCGPERSKQPWINSGMERKWLLVQVLLAAELLFRLDAFVRGGLLQNPHEGAMTAPELQRFDQLREGKVNWDLNFARRFLDNLDISSEPESSSTSPTDQQSGSSPVHRDKSPLKPRRFSLFDSITRRISSTQGSDLKSPWDCHISSPYVHLQLEGLYVFAENIGWPGVDALRDHFQKLCSSGQEIFDPQLERLESRDHTNNSDKYPTVSGENKDLYGRSRCRRYVRLRSLSGESHESNGLERIGWLSRSWLSGLVLPGEAICHLLIGTLLENDGQAVEKLGPVANLYGGFIYKGRSYWSKASIVGRVLSCLQGAQTCMGWVGCSVLPCEESTATPLADGWFEVPMQKAPRGAGKSRIKQGGKLAMESTPLGTGDIIASSFTLPVDPLMDDHETEVQMTQLSLLARTSQQGSITECEQATMTFSMTDTRTNSSTTISYPLKYHVRFVSAHPCQRPHAFTACRPEDSIRSHAHETGPPSPDPGPLRRLPSHPLHQSYRYEYVKLDSIPDQLSLDESQPILVIDARGCRSKEAFVRAWCASVGCHALIGRVGKMCVACCVREARALDIRVVVRVGQ
ncbi:Uncharacterized protein PECH_002647 [Penicillium ucsense]|uniref:Uncharacterized protein n=1 Tax=Penicillium ucsense TaxID=2839758 RepID=A0A8J8WIW9_9EURO|nr:Uncharacterized protein PECM_003636 [Penicillium ucsense]KAF7737821.1 Uncharacterized protein PECH_002647 [Penicillium ucsense]